jgi:hypothetical protein
MVLVQLFPAAMRIARVLSIHTDLSAVGVEGRLLWVLFYGLGVEIYSGIPVMFFESLVSLLLELDSLLDRSHCHVGGKLWQVQIVDSSFLDDFDKQQTDTHLL